MCLDNITVCAYEGYSIALNCCGNKKVGANVCKCVVPRAVFITCGSYCACTVCNVLGVDNLTVYGEVNSVKYVSVLLGNCIGVVLVILSTGKIFVINKCSESEAVFVNVDNEVAYCTVFKAVHFFYQTGSAACVKALRTGDAGSLYDVCTLAGFGCFCAVVYCTCAEIYVMVAGDEDVNIILVKERLEVLVVSGAVYSEFACGSVYHVDMGRADDVVVLACVGFNNGACPVKCVFRVTVKHHCVIVKYDEENAVVVKPISSAVKVFNGACAVVGVAVFVLIGDKLGCGTFCVLSKAVNIVLNSGV